MATDRAAAKHTHTHTQGLGDFGQKSAIANPDFFFFSLKTQIFNFDFILGGNRRTLLLILRRSGGVRGGSSGLLTAPRSLGQPERQHTAIRSRA